MTLIINHLLNNIEIFQNAALSAQNYKIMMAISKKTYFEHFQKFPNLLFITQTLIIVFKFRMKITIDLNVFYKHLPIMTIRLGICKE